MPASGQAYFAPENLLEQAEALLIEGRAGEAASLIEKQIQEGRSGLLACLLHARALIAAGRPAEALDSARETALLFSGAAPAALELAKTLLGAGQLPTAIAECQRALRIDPDLAEARYVLGCAWLEAGEPEKAFDAFGQIPAAEEPSGLAAKRLEAAEMQNAPRSNARYIRHLFDQFSADYDSRMLGELNYTAPNILRHLASLLSLESMNGRLAILDLGCGTGLAGAAFHDLAHRLDGIDLAPAMVEKARGRDIYDRLMVGDIVSPAVERDAYDLVVAADTLVYLGDLDEVFAIAFHALRRCGYFLFTVEACEGMSFSLGPKRRWQHSEEYLRSLVERHGFVLSGLLQCSPRTEAGVPVEGIAAALMKPA
ncbi:MAG: methyltransferase domain-containing protein [Alphaproteobacteria bacterium]|nr:methyltransferase domain-containing protein [Alphaproteobacteria bacterium]